MEEGAKAVDTSLTLAVSCPQSFREGHTQTVWLPRYLLIRLEGRVRRWWWWGGCYCCSCECLLQKCECCSSSPPRPETDRGEADGGNTFVSLHEALKTLDITENTASDGVGGCGVHFCSPATCDILDFNKTEHAAHLKVQEMIQ